MRRTPLARGTKGLVTKTPLATKSPPKKGTKVNSTSKQRKQKLAAESDIRALYLINHPHCEIGQAMLMSPDPKVRRYYRAICQGTADACHERKKRSAGGSTIDPVNLMSACNPCNTWVEDNPPIAGELGLTVLGWQQPADVPVARREESNDDVPEVSQNPVDPETPHRGS